MPQVRVPDFLPSTSGLHFVNYFPHEPEITIKLPLGPTLSLGDAANGLCGGMAFVVRDFYEAKQAVPPDTQPPPGGSPLYAFIVQRLMDSFNLPLGITRYIELMQPAFPDVGLGFGLFIDELGKFITSDNNYFYRPAIALIYVVFVLLFHRLRSFDRHRPVSAEIYLANALVLLQEAAIHELDPHEKRRLIRWVRLSGKAGTDLLGDDAIRRLEARPPDLVPQSRVTRVLRVARRTVTRGLRSRWTERIAVPVLLVRLLGGVAVAGVLALTRDTSLAGGFQHSPLLIATAISSLMAVIGLIRLPLSRIHALRWFKRSILTTILLTDVFVFYYQQLGGLSDLVIDLILLGVFEAIIDAQHTRTSSPSPHAREGPTLSPSPLAGEGRGGG